MQVADDKRGINTDIELKGASSKICKINFPLMQLLDVFNPSPIGLQIKSS